MVKNYPHTNQSAYLMGVALGDGDISVVGRSLRLRLFCDNKYPALMKRWKIACKGVFGSSVNTISWGKNCTVVYIYSVMLRDFPWRPKCGKKWEQRVSIPEWITNNDEFLVPCIRGLFESDGCIYTQTIKGKKKNYSYKRINFKNSSAWLVADVLGFLQDNDISHSLYGDDSNSGYVKRTTCYCIQVIDYDKFQRVVGLSKA